MKKFSISIVIIGLTIGIHAQSWKIVNVGTTKGVFSVFFPAKDVGYACGDSGLIVKSIDGGNTWVQQNSGTNMGLFDIFFIDADTGYAIGGRDLTTGFVLKTTNGGNSWTSKTFCNSQPTRIIFTTPTTGYISAGYSCGTGIYKTIDAGKTWVSKSNPNSSIWNHAMFFTNPNNAYIVGSYAKINKTTDAGESWSGTINMTAHGFGDLWFTDENTGFAVGGGGVAKTTDAGANWSNAAKFSSQGYGSIRFVNKSIGYITGSEGLFKTVDGGLTWDLQNTNYTKGIGRIFFVDSVSGFICGSKGDILKTVNVCYETFTNDTSIYNVSSLTFSAKSPKIIFETTDSLQTHQGGCDSIVHRYSKFVYNPHYFTDSISIEDTLNIQVLITELTAPNNVNEMKVYPNPAKDNIWIDCGDYAKMNGYTIKLVNSSAIEKWSTTVTQQLYSVDLNGYSKGIYLLEIYDGGNQKVEVKKIVLY